MVVAFVFTVYIASLSQPQQHVAVDSIYGEDSDGCGIESLPCQSIRKGVMVAQAMGFHHVQVQGGATYVGECNFGGTIVGGNLTIEGLSRSGVDVIVDCGGHGTLFNITGGSFVLSGCRIHNARSRRGAIHAY